MRDVTTALLDSDETLEALRHADARSNRDGCDWLELRRQILAYGGIGASPDFPRDWIPGDLYRANGHAPDLVAAEAVNAAPWGDSGDDSAMLTYLRQSWATWQRIQTREREQVTRRTSKPVKPARGTRSFAELVRELQAKHGADVDLSGLRSEYVNAYETGERVTLERDGRTYRGTVGATRGQRPRFVLLLSMDL